MSAPPTATGYPPIPALADLLVDDQFDLATELGVALVKLPDDHPVMIAVNLACELRQRMRDEQLTSIDEQRRTRG